MESPCFARKFIDEMARFIRFMLVTWLVSAAMAARGTGAAAKGEGAGSVGPAAAAFSRNASASVTPTATPWTLD